MAQVILSRAGSAIGSRLAPQAFRGLASTLGRAVGSYAGSRIDDALFSSAQRYEGRKLSDIHIQSSTEGASIPLIFGRARVSGQVIWAAKFKEKKETSSTSSGKGGSGGKSTEYTYSLSFAVGLCEGEVSRIAGAWANGEKLDLSTVTWRLHKGASDQEGDPLIEAIEGVDYTPAYRDLAYIVFEDLPLDEYGNVMPQMSFEVVRPPAASGLLRMEDQIKGVCLIPGAGEFVYASEPVRRVSGYGEEKFENVHAESERANLLVSLDQLERDLPNCRSVMLVAAWFGDDLRCGQCQIRPGVEIASKTTRPLTWRTGDVTRSGALLLSLNEGAPAYGGSPADASVVQAIRELKARGFKVGLYPFLLMDVPSGNGKPDPYGGQEQGAYPWRGRVTCHPAPGQANTPDKTPAAKAQIEAFFGTAAARDFSIRNTNVSYSGPDEWSFRRFLLHYAKLAQAAGGVNAFVMGSEMVGLTGVRDGAASFPGVSALQSLAGEVRAVLGAETTLTYAADWSEYHGIRPADGSGDVFFHLDPLWADAAIDVVGIDWYPPLTDWRDGDGHADQALASSIHDGAYLQGRIEAGENYDFYYPDDAARDAQARLAITDGAYGEPWVHRAKDLRAWWANAHHDRPGGVRASAPTAWTPQSKPVWIVELGAPAVDKGTNAPNRFIDPKSAESAYPPYSSGAADDLIQRRALEAYFRHWAENSLGNPTSSIYGGPMVAPEGIHVWTWDARPHPHFPARDDVWVDGSSWRLGHWLTGRAGAATLPEVVEALCARSGVSDIDVTGLSGIVTGGVFDSPFAPRAALETLMAVHDFHVVERDGVLVFEHPGAAAIASLSLDDLALGKDGRGALTRADAAEAPEETRVQFLDGAREHRVTTVSARRRDGSGVGVTTVEAALTLDPDAAEAVAERLLAQAHARRDRLSVTLPPSRLALEAGDCVAFDGLGVRGDFVILSLEEGGGRKAVLAPITARTASQLSSPTPSARSGPTTTAAPDVLILDLPPLPGEEDDERPLAAVRARPWLGTMNVLAGGDAGAATVRGSAASPAATGALQWDLYAGPLHRWDEGNVTRITLYEASLESVDAASLLAGANVFAVQGANGAWEILQARQATLVGDNTYELRGLLRGLQGTQGAMANPVAAGARIVKLDSRLVRLDMRDYEIGAPMVWGAALAGRTLLDASATTVEAVWRKIWARPFSLVHLRSARLSDGGVRVSWVRRTRRGGDAWNSAETPLGEESEAYRVEILAGGAVARTVETQQPSYTYAGADLTADLGASATHFTVRVAQLSATYGAGASAESTIWL